MSRMKTVFAALLLAAMAALVPAASATVTSKVAVAIVGSSAMWQTMALAAYNGGLCPSTPVTHNGCLHYTGNANFNLNDTRPTIYGGSVNNDPGGIWIVWDQPTTGTRNVWVYLKVDSIVGDRCFFANPKCTITAPSGYVWSTLGGKISTALWGSDSVPPPDVEALFGPGVTANTAATDVRPEDALFEQCRVNSALGQGTPGFDGLDGLGYNSSNASGTCPAFSLTRTTNANLVGSPIHSGISGSTAAANVLAFNISGHDPFTNNTVSAGTTVDVGAAPIVFIYSRSSTANTGLTGFAGTGPNITDAQAQDIFSGVNCNASEFGLPAAPIDAFLREPLSGTMTTTEMSVFRRPTKTVEPNAVLGVSQETGVGGVTLAGGNCGGGGNRFRGIGTGEVTNGAGSVGGVLHGGGANNDAIAYTFFSFGNVSKLTGPTFGYFTLNGFDPIGLGSADQELPSCTAPCPESSFPAWAGGSFPALRAGNYTAWSLLRMVTSSTTNLKALVATSHKYVVDDTPDYIPAVKTAGATGSDAGVQIWHSHYQQYDGNGSELTSSKIGGAPSNGTFDLINLNPTGSDKGGDAGGCTFAITSTITTSTKKNFIQTGPAVADCTLDRE